MNIFCLNLIMIFMYLTSMGKEMVSTYMLVLKKEHTCLFIIKGV